MTTFFILAAVMAAAALAFVLRPLLAHDGEARLRWHASALGVAVPALACLLYAALGTPAGLVPPPPPQVIGDVQIEAMVQRLADRLKGQPNDADGWRRLARSYETLRRFEPAADAYRQLLVLEPDNLDARLNYAVVLGMAMGGSLKGAPEQQILAVLERDPKHLQALALAGSAALERNEKDAAVAYWKRILAVAPAGSEMYESIAKNLAQAELRD